MIAIAAPDVVIHRVCTNGCRRRPEHDLPASYAFSYPDATKERLLFIPKELTDEGYTARQLEEIERRLACHGFDLLPLDYNVN